MKSYNQQEMQETSKTGIPVNRYTMPRLKLYRRGERCQVPEGSEYIMVVSEGFDEEGNWIPTEAQTFKTMSQMKDTVRQIAAKASGIVVQASPQFAELAKELKLATLTVEWGCL